LTVVCVTGVLYRPVREIAIAQAKEKAFCLANWRKSLVCKGLQRKSPGPYTVTLYSVRTYGLAGVSIESHNNVLITYGASVSK
jgi:hypothetical protein